MSTDPAHDLGFAAERGAGTSQGANRNLPLPPGGGDDEWLAALAGVQEGSGGPGCPAGSGAGTPRGCGWR